MVRERVGIGDVVAEVVTLRNAGGGNLKGLCPFHDERTPSFQVTPARGLYYCFGCGEGGDVVDFVMKVDALAFTEAIEKLAARAGVVLRYEDGAPGPARHGETRMRLLAANRRAADFFAAALAGAVSAPEVSRAREFLAGRGFPEQSWATFGVGVAPKSWDALLRHMRAGGFTDAEALSAGLVSQGQRGFIDRFRGRLVWPIRDAAGEVLGFGARKLLDDDDGPKYLNTPETALYKKSHVLYGLDLARREIAKRRQVVVVEGYTDVMAAHLAGVPTAVATCGTAFGPEHANVLRRYLMDDDTFAGEVIFTFDGDAAGQKAAMRAFAGDQKFVAQTFVAVSPDGMDPCDLRLSLGDAALAELVARRTPLFEFAIRALLRGHDLETAEGRVAALRQAAPVVAGIRDTSLRPEYQRMLAGWLGMPEGAVREAVAGAQSPVGRAGASRPAPPARSGGQRRAGSHNPELMVERESLKCALQAPELVAQWYGGVEPTCYLAEPHQATHLAIAAAGGPQDGLSGLAWVDRVLAACPDDAVRDEVRQLAVEPVAGNLDRRYAVSVVAKLLANDTVRQVGRLKARMSRLDPIVDAQEVGEIFGDVMALESYRRELGQAAAEVSR